MNVNMKRKLEILFVIATIAVLGVTVVYAVASHITYSDAPPVDLNILTPTPLPSPAPTATPTPTPTPTASPEPTPQEITGTQAISFLEPPPNYAGQPLTVIVTLTPPHATNVTLYVNGNPYKTVQSTTAGIATFTITGAEIGVGNYTWTAKASAVTVP